MPLEPFPLPLVALPEGFDWERRSISQVSTTTAFNTGIDRRDIFRGQRCCIVCGESAVVEHGYIIPESEPDVVSTAIVSVFVRTHGMRRVVVGAQRTWVDPARSQGACARTAQRLAIVPQSP